MSPAAALSTIDPPLPLAVAYSGGADSTALLHLALRKWPGRVQAIHIHHGLQAAADAFDVHCKSECAALRVPLHAVRIDARHAPGESPEDAARRARYAALADTAQQHGLRCVLLGQHADDQVETMLLALSRGAGLPGLAAMPLSFERHGMLFLRPLLKVAAPAIREWLTSEGIGHVEDPTNTDIAFTRNRIRAQLLPALEGAFPQFRDTFARSARHAAEAQRLLTAVAAQDLEEMQGEMSIAALQRLSRERQANVVRHWLRTVHGQSASAAQLAELLDQVAACTTRGHRLHVKVGRGYVSRAEASLQFTSP